MAFLHMGFPACGTPAYGNPACGIAACGIPACGASKKGFSSADDFSVQSEYNLNKKSILFGTLQFSGKNITCQQHSCIPFRNPACGDSCYMAILHVGIPVYGILAYGVFKKGIPCV
jgi:hypothetical protein